MRRTEDGSATLEMVLATPLLMLCILLIIQFGVWEHASSVARAAAQDGLRMTRTDGGTAADGENRAYSLMGQLGQNVLVSPTVTVDRNDDMAAIRIDAYSQSLIPGVSLPIHAFATGPVEQFRPGAN